MDGTGDLYAVSQVPRVGFESLTEAERRRIDAVPTMIHHGVRSEQAVPRLMNSAPRSAAGALRELY